jgi:hypothetical protein
MTAAVQFATNIAAADAFVAMYRELRQNRGLGARGPLPAAHVDLLWLPRYVTRRLHPEAAPRRFSLRFHSGESPLMAGKRVVG